MNSTWTVEIWTVFKKELQTSLRSKSDLSATALFSIVTVIALAIAAFRERLSGSMCAGLIWVALLFASVVSLPRAFVVEEEQKTADLLRLWARPHAVFWGKVLFNLLQVAVTALVLSFLLFLLVDVKYSEAGNGRTDLALYIVCLLGGSGALAGTVTLCGAIVAQAQNRSALAGVLAIPLLLPFVFLAVTGLRIAIDPGLIGNGTSAAIGLWAYAVATLAIGPYLFAAIWKS